MAVKSVGRGFSGNNSGLSILLHGVIMKFFRTKATADIGVMSSIPAQSHTFVEIDHELISTAILIQEVLLSVTSESMRTKYRLTASSSVPRKKCG